MQTRWATALIKSEIPYPPVEEMKADIARYKKTLKKNFVKSPRHTLETEFFGYMDVLAEEIGVKPTLMGFLRSFGFWKGLGTASSVYFGPPSGIHYRFFGKGKKPKLARLAAARIARGDNEEMNAEEIKELEKYRPTNW
jgi:dimethylaniline monooxygenase (N-oxide forming)